MLSLLQLTLPKSRVIKIQSSLRVVRCICLCKWHVEHVVCVGIVGGSCVFCMMDMDMDMNLCYVIKAYPIQGIVSN